MKKIGQIFLFTALVLFTTFLGCKKDESEDMIDILTSKNWKFGLVDKNAATNPSGDNLYYAVLECEQDDTFTFRTDGTMLRAYGSKKCTGNDAVNKIVPYSFNKETRELSIDGVKYTVAEENKTQFKYFLVTPGTTGVNNTIYLLQ
jgi:hypothetical protein